MDRTNTLIDQETPSGRIAVLARKTAADPWRQVESYAVLSEARTYADSLEADAALRADVVDEWALENWGSDAPAKDPN